MNRWPVQIPFGQMQAQYWWRSKTQNTAESKRWDVCYLPFIHLVVCLTTGPKPLPKRALRIVRSRASFFKWENSLLSLRSSSSFLRLLPRLPNTSIPHFIILSFTNRCHFFVIFLYYMSLPYMFRASISQSSGVSPAVATCCHLVHVVLGVCPRASGSFDVVTVVYSCTRLSVMYMRP